MYKKLLISLFLTTSIHCGLVMINPAGDARNPGRVLSNGYERGLTLRIAEKLKEEIQDRYDIKCHLTRAPGEEVLELQSASFANRLKADFYLSLHVYREEAIKPKLSLYYLVYNPMVDLITHNLSPLEFLSIRKAHLVNMNQTRSIANKMQSILTNDEYKRKIDVYSPRGIPFKPLRGVMAPAIAVEIGLKEEDKWKSFIEPIVESLRFLLSI